MDEDLGKGHAQALYEARVTFYKSNFGPAP